MRNLKKITAVIASVLIFSISSVGQASADQTIDFDVTNFQSDGFDNEFEAPVYNVYGLEIGEMVIINVSNSNYFPIIFLNSEPDPFVDISGVVNALAGDFDPGFLVLSSGVYGFVTDNTPTGSYTIRITVGSNFSLVKDVNPLVLDGFYFAHFSNSPESALGVVSFFQDVTFSEGAEVVGSIHLFSSGTPRTSSAAVVRTGNALRLDTQGATTEKNNVVSCTPGKYTFLNGGSTAEEAKIQSYVYTLLVNGKAVSTLSSDNFKSVASHMFPTIAGNMAGTATLEGATWDLKGMSNYSAACQVYATQSSGNIQSVTSEVHDAVALAAAAEAAANVARDKEIISTWNATNEELAKKYRDQRLVAQP
jgi:hypothetical protein